MKILVRCILFRGSTFPEIPSVHQTGIFLSLPEFSSEEMEQCISWLGSAVDPKPGVIKPFPGAHVCSPNKAKLLSFLLRWKCYRVNLCHGLTQLKASHQIVPMGQILHCQEFMSSPLVRFSLPYMPSHLSLSYAVLWILRWNIPCFTPLIFPLKTNKQNVAAQAWVFHSRHILYMNKISLSVQGKQLAVFAANDKTPAFRGK